MISIHCTLVGFRHHAWRGTQLEERLARAIGQEVVLMRDRENHRNPEAAIACIDSEVVAYVNNDDCHRIAARDLDYCYLEVHLLFGQIMINRLRRFLGGFFRFEHLCHTSVSFLVSKPSAKSPSGIKRENIKHKPKQNIFFKPHNAHLAFSTNSLFSAYS